MQQHHLWNSAGLTLQMSVNLSGRSLHDSDLCDHIAKLLAQWQINPEHFQLEITERALMYDPIQANQTLSQLDAMGIKLSIDDFGTGYSSLSYIAKLPVSTLKIDRAFIINMTSNSDDLSIVSTIITLAHALKMRVVAEGVETGEQARLLRLLKCDEIQGFLFSPGVPAEQIEHFLREGKSMLG